ncbi:hypothetical protein [Dactylosporangium sp. NPDC000521]|uniref:hypothetical protein n=1 Tax=Dactylosporangium sp. NPDC000521 TaxID=3363975 RepID=UPI0036B657E8
MTRWEKFDDAGAVLAPSPFEEFDVEFDAALVRRGDVHVDGDFTGGDLYRLAGVGSTDELTAFVIDGDLTVGGTLDLDEDAPRRSPSRSPAPRGRPSSASTPRCCTSTAAPS